MSVTPLVLENSWVRLEPLRESHRAGLARFSDDADVWRYSMIPKFEPWFVASLKELADGTSLPFAVRRKSDGLLVGSTRYLNMALAHRRVEVGNTWYGPDARNSHVNPACKMLLLTHAFEVLGVARLELKCDARNLPSRGALKKLGAKEEGTLRRQWMLSDGHLRDTVYFSVLEDEWPSVRAGLDARLRQE